MSQTGWRSVRSIDDDLRVDRFEVIRSSSVSVEIGRRRGVIATDSYQSRECPRVMRSAPRRGSRSPTRSDRSAPRQTRIGRGRGLSVVIQRHPPHALNTIEPIRCSWDCIDGNHRAGLRSALRRMLTGCAHNAAAGFAVAWKRPLLISPPVCARAIASSGAAIPHPDRPRDSRR